MKATTFTLLAALLLGLAHASPAADALSETLQKGLFEEEANHNLDAAIKAYQAVLQQTDEQRKFAATAVFRLGECYRKLGKTNEAAAQYERILDEFSGETALATLSRQNLAGLGAAPKAMAPRTLSKAARVEQKRLLEQEIKLADQDLQRLTELVKQGVATHASLVPPQREILELRRQLAGLDLGADDTATTTETAAQAAATFDEEKEVQRLRALIKESPDLINSSEQQQTGDWTLLQQAALSGHLAVARFLLANKADVNGRGKNRAGTPLNVAAERGHKSMVELLLANGADVNAAGGSDTIGGTALHAAAANGFNSVAEVLIANKADVNARNKEGRTPLHSAAEAGQESLAEFLLAKGADANAKDSIGWTPLHFAVQYDRPKLVDLLLSRKAEVDPVSTEGATPLFWAVKTKNAGCADILLKNGANVNLKPEHGSSPLRYALTTASPELLKLLLAHKPDLEAQDNDGLTLLQAAIYERQNNRLPAEMVELLLSGGSDINAPFKPIGEAVWLERAQHQFEITDNTPLMVAIRKPRPDFVEALLSHGADVNAKSPQGKTALHYAVEYRSLPMVQAILAHHPDMEIRDHDGYTPFGRIIFGDLKILEALIKAGADMNAPLAEGNTMLHYAVGNRRKDMVELLVTNKAEVNVMNKVGETPLVWTQAKRYANLSQVDHAALDEIATFLLKHGADENIPRRAVIGVSRKDRNLSSSVFFKGTNASNRYTLLELVAASYIAPSSTGFGESAGLPAYAFPDFANVKIKRLSSKAGGKLDSSVDLEKIFQSGDCSQDLDLEWGDVIEIPELDHGINEPWPGLPEQMFEVLKKCLKRDVEIVVKGERAKVTLMPITPALPQGFGGAGFRPPRGSEAVGAAPASSRNSWKSISTFRLKGVMIQANVVRVSSDLSRVKVKRTDPKTGQTQELLFNLSEGAPYDARTDLWLRDGDVIEVPEK